MAAAQNAGIETPANAVLCLKLREARGHLRVCRVQKHATMLLPSVVQIIRRGVTLGDSPCILLDDIVIVKFLGNVPILR